MSAARRSSTGLTPYVVLAACLVLTAGAATYAHRSNAEQDRLRFENAADRVKGAIENRLDSYLAMLLGGTGLFAASEDVNWQEFHAYVERLELPRRYPGIQGIGFSRLVQPSERAAVAAVARRYAPKFGFWPEQPDRPIHAIVFLEPQNDGNRFALGFDMSTEARRAEGMARARDTGAPAATAGVTLVQTARSAPTTCWPASSDPPTHRASSSICSTRGPAAERCFIGPRGSSNRAASAPSVRSTSPDAAGR
jgi:CHASE1-domain containing sensor protein